MADDKPTDRYQMTWGRPFTPTSKIRTWVGLDLDMVEIGEDAVTFRVRAGYWTDRATTLLHGETWNVYLNTGSGRVGADATEVKTYFLNVHGDGNTGDCSSDKSVGVFLDRTVEVPRKSVDYQVMAWVSGTFWGTWFDGDNGLGVKLFATVPRKDSDVDKLRWGAWFTGSNGIRARMGVKAWVTRVTPTSATVRCQLGYWSEGKTTLTSKDSWWAALCDPSKAFNRTIVRHSGTGDLESAPPTSHQTVAYLEDFTQDVDLRADAWPVDLECGGRILGRDLAGTQAPTARVTVPAVGVEAPEAPAAPAVELAGGVATLTWADGSDPGSGHPWETVSVWRADGEGGPVRLATLPSSTLLWRDTTLSEGVGYRWYLTAANRAGESGRSPAAEAWTRPLPPEGVEAERLSGTAVALTWSLPETAVTGFEVQRRAGSSWSSVGDDADLGPAARRWVDGEVPEEAVRYRVRTESKGGTSPWAESREVAYVCAPEAPAVAGVSPGQVVSSASPRSVEWEPNHPDASPQTAAEVDVDGAVTRLGADARSMALAGLADGDHSVSVRTRGASEEWGPWSAPVDFTVATPPAVGVTYPAEDGALVSSLPLTVCWDARSAYGIVSVEVAVCRPDGTSAGRATCPGGDAWEMRAGDFDLADGGEYTLTVTARDGLGYTGSGSREFHVAFVPPALPSVRVSADEDALCCYLWCEESGESVSSAAKAGAFQAGGGIVTAGHGLRWKTMAFPPTDHFDVFRLDPSGELEAVAAGVHALDMVVDPTPPLNAAYRYRVDAVSADGERSSRWADAYVDSHDAVALNYGPDLAAMARLVYDLDAGSSAERDGEAYRFPGAGSSGRWGGAELPVWYPGPGGDGGAEVSGCVLDFEEAMAWQRAFRAAGPALYRDLFGERRRVAVSGSVDVSHSEGRQWDVSASMREVGA